MPAPVNTVIFVDAATICLAARTASSTPLFFTAIFCRESPAKTSNRRTQIAMAPNICDFTNTEIFVSEWVDPVLTASGFDACGDYVETYWLGVIGPSATWVLRYLSRELEVFPNGYCLDLADTAAALGLAFRHGSGSLERAIQRCATFGLVAQLPQSLAVRRRLPALTKRQLLRLPTALQHSHNELFAKN